MDSLFHFLFVFLFLLAARVHIKHHFFAPLFFAFITLLPDADHFFGMQARVTLHNVFFTVLFPAILVIIAFLFEKKGVFWKQFTIILLVVLMIHPVLDLSSNPPIQYFWPVSEKGYTLSNMNYTTELLDRPDANLVSPLSVSMLIAIFLMLPVVFLEETINFMSRKKEPPGKAAKDTVIELKRELRRP